MSSKKINSSKAGNSFERVKPTTGNYSVLQLFVDSPWKKNQIKNLGEWLKSRDIDVNQENWCNNLLKYGNLDSMYDEPNAAIDENAFKNQITFELKNILPFLLECNDDIKFTNENGQTILHVYLSNNESNYRNWRSTTGSKILEIINCLISKGASVNITDKWGMTPLHVAAKAKKLEVVRLMLVFFSNVDAYDEQGNTVVHTVLDQNSDEGELCSYIVKILLMKGADVNWKNKAGMTPVQLAVRRHNIDLLQALKENGADFRVFTENDENLLLLAYKHYLDNVEDSKMIEITNFLVKQGCDVNARNKDGYSSLHYALPRSRLVKKLIELGADVNCQTKIKLQTPLHITVELRSQSSDTNTMALLRAGADCNALDIKGRTPLEIALENNYTTILIIILKVVGKINSHITIKLWRQCYKETRDLMICHADKMRTIGFPINKVYELHLNPPLYSLQENRNDCEKEVNKLKTYMISNNVSIYTFLHMDPRRRLTYVECLPQDLESMFPIYANFILTARHEAIRRSQLLEPAKMAWYQTTNIYLPDICVERVLYFLNNWDLKVFIDTAEGTLD